MPGRIPPAFIDELLARTDIVEVIGSRIELKRSGQNHKGLCPFHGEKTPSFNVNATKQFYYCFGCQASGHALRFLMEYEHLDFPSAVEMLAGQAGLEVPREAMDARAEARQRRRKSILDVLAQADAYFREQLRRHPNRARVVDYLKGRGISGEIARDYGIGFAPPGTRNLQAALQKSNEDRDLLIAAGLVREDGDRSYELFRDRVMFPVRNLRGQVIAFGGRIMGDGQPKYLNSPETEVFRKGSELYALYDARRSGHLDRLLVVEGYMDAIALANAGIGEAVAPLGTALTENQIELLWRQVERPILCFDGDNAGQRAAMRAIGRVLPLLRPGHSLAIVRMPAGMDPDDLIREKGIGAMEELLSSASGLLDTLWQFERDAVPLESPEDKAGLKERLMVHVEAIQHPDIRALYKRELQDRFSDFAFPPRQQRPFKPRGEWHKNGFKQQAPRLSQETAERLKRAISGGSRDTLTSAVIHGLLLHPGEILRHESALARFAMRDPNAGPAIDSLLAAAEMLDSRAQSPISLPEGLPAPPANTRFAFLDKGTDPVDAREDLAEAVSLLVERPALEAALAEATARFEIDPEGAFADQQRLLKRKLEFEARLGQMASRRAATAATKDSETAQGLPPGGGA